MDRKLTKVQERTYYEIAYPATRKLIEAILHIAEAEAYIQGNGDFEFPEYFKERLKGLREVIEHIKTPEGLIEMEEFLRCFDQKDFSTFIQSEEPRKLSSWFIGAIHYAKEKRRAKSGT